jgi:hypothetical protein
MTFIFVNTEKILLTLNILLINQLKTSKQQTIGYSMF